MEDHRYEVWDGANGKEAISVDMQELIRELRSAVEGARSMPMSSSAVINRNEVLDILGKLEHAVPGALEQSERVYADRDAVLAQAQEEAKRIVEDAVSERDRLVSETDVYKLARRHADELSATVRTECDGLRQETDEYVDTRLANLEIGLKKTLETVTRGRDRLHGRHQLDPQSLDSLAANDADEPPLPQH